MFLEVMFHQVMAPCSVWDSDKGENEEVLTSAITC